MSYNNDKTRKKDGAGMTQYNHDSRTSLRQTTSREHADGTGKGKIVPPRPPRPKGRDRDEWVAYWQTQGQSWRTELEIPPERQKELATCRATPVDIEKGVYPCGGMKLDRADVEWLLATHENGRGPVVWSDEQQRDRKGLDLRGADLRDDENRSMNLSKLPLTRLSGALTYEERDRLAREGLFAEQYIKALIQLEGANLYKAQLEEANLYEAQLKGTDLTWAQLKGANLTWAQLKGANLTGAQLEGANLTWAQLEGADLTWAQLKEADLSGAQLKEA